jgi:hypothetical protein
MRVLNLLMRPCPALLLDNTARTKLHDWARIVNNHFCHVVVIIKTGSGPGSPAGQPRRVVVATGQTFNLRDRPVATVPGSDMEGIAINMSRRCPKCGEEKLRTWDELKDDEREVVRRLPGSGDYGNDERKSMHRWCTRCWHEEIGDGERLA